jgi:hypothetical protein
VTVGIDPAGAELTSWNYTVVLERPDGTTQQLASDTLSSGGEASPSFNLSGEANATVRVNVGWETANGRSMVSTERFRIVPDYEGYSLLDGLFEFPTLLSSGATAATSMIALFVTVLGAGATGLKFRASTEAIGLVATGTLAIFAIIDWIGYAVVFAAGVVWVALVALRRGI